MNTPTVNSEPSVEEALRELRKMFPRQSIRLEFQVTAGGSLRVFFTAMEFEVIGVKSLSEAMSKVRKWKESQSS